MNGIELFPKQAEFFELDNRINVYMGGIQSAKTTSGGLKMYVANLTHRSPDDNFIVAADTYKTLNQATIPRFLKYAGNYGTLNRSSMEFKTHWGSTVFLRTATDPESVEGITNVRRIWLDEGGKVSLYFFENLMGRAAFKQCPIDITTTPYSLNWLAKLWDDFLNNKRDDVSFVQCKSVDSPYFPKAEYERQKKLLDPKRFAMKYDGVPGKMEGLVYADLNLCNSFQLPSGTLYYAGIDWGFNPDPFCLVVRGVTPDGVHYRVDEYYRNYLTISEIVNVVKQFKSIYNLQYAYCDPSQPAHIEELNRHGVKAMGAQNDIQYGIDKHLELIKSERFWVFEDRCRIGLDEYNSYHYREDQDLKYDESRAKKDTLPVDANNHGCDADRYLSIMLAKMSGEKRAPQVPSQQTGRSLDLQKRSEWIRKGSKVRVIA